MKEIADKLHQAGTVYIPKESIHDELTVMATSISTVPFMARNRSYEQIYKDCSCISIEHALVKVLGGERNPHKFDKTNPESYKYDVIIDNKLFEAKRHLPGNTYFTYQKESMTTFLKHSQELDYLVTAYKTDSDDQYCIDFVMIVLAKRFAQDFKQSQFNSGWYYDHRNNDNCIQFGIK